MELDVSGCCMPYDNTTLGPLSVATSLSRLSLDATGITDDGVQRLLRYTRGPLGIVSIAFSCRHLSQSVTHLSISGSNGVTDQGLVAVLQRKDLLQLSAVHCSIMSPLSKEIRTLLRACSLNYLDLSRNCIGNSDRQCLVDAWVAKGRKMCSLIL